MTDIELIRNAEAAGYVIFWNAGAAHFVREELEHDRAQWSRGYDTLDTAAIAALVDGDLRTHAEGHQPQIADHLPVEGSDARHAFNVGYFAVRRILASRRFAS